MLFAVCLLSISYSIQMHSSNEHLAIFFSSIFQFLQEEEKSCLHATSQSLRALVKSCSQWRVGELLCISTTPSTHFPDNFTYSKRLLIQCSKQPAHDECPEPEYLSIEDGIYPILYLESCFIACTSYGWGMFARKTIPAHTPVITYTGELISNEETDRRQRIYDHKVKALRPSSLTQQPQ